MSSNIETVLVRDDILNISDKIGYAVAGCPQNVSTQVFTAISATGNSQIYTITVPSTTTILSRELLWSCEFTVNFSGTPANGVYLFLPSKFFALGPMCLSQMCSNLALQINTTTSSVTLNRILDPVMRCMDRKQFADAYNTTPTYLDTVGNYPQLNTGTYYNNPLAGYGEAFDPLYVPRGSVKIKSIVNPIGTNPPTLKTGSITYVVTEPIFLSPFVYDGSSGNAGLSGISNINATFNMDPLGARGVRWYNNGVNDLAVTSVDYVPAKCSLECVFVTPAIDQLVPSTCVTPYCNITKYSSAQNSPLVATASADFNSSNIQLNGVPDGIIVNVRPQFGGLKPKDADSYCTINNISINFDNQNGLLSSASQALLWNLSKEAGSSQSWLEFSGQATITPVGNEYSDLTKLTVPTSGSVLYLKFGTHITIPNAYNAPGSAGNFNLQLRVGATNNTGVDMDGTTANLPFPELNIIVVQSGIFVSQNGQSSTYLNVLTRQEVLDAKLQAPVARTELKRLLGGGFFSSLKAIAQKAMPHVRALVHHVTPHVKSFVKEHVVPAVKHHLSQSESPLAQLAHAGIERAGYGMSAGGMSGGRVRRHLKM
jgi:hypothetical protein